RELAVTHSIGRASSSRGNGRTWKANGKELERRRGLATARLLMISVNAPNLHRLIIDSGPRAEVEQLISPSITPLAEIIAETTISALMHPPNSVSKPLNCQDNRPDNRLNHPPGRIIGDTMQLGQILPRFLQALSFITIIFNRIKQFAPPSCSCRMVVRFGTALSIHDGVLPARLMKK